MINFSNIVILIVTIIAILVIYNLYKNDNLKGAFIFRVIFSLGRLLIEGNIAKYFSLMKYLKLGFLWITALIIIGLIVTFVTNLLEYFVGFRFTKTFIGFFIVCVAIEIVLQISGTGLIYIIANLFGINTIF